MQRTEELNRALHELRRPLQALLLLEQGNGVPAAAPPVAARRGLIELAVCAMEQLDRAVNGRAGGRPVRRRVSSRELVLASLQRRQATGEAGAVKVYWDAGPAYVEGDPGEVARAFDNLFANAIEHGRAPVVITGAQVAGKVRITVANQANAASGPSELPSPGDPRRGHGIPIVSEIARSHGGRFAFYRSSEGCVAALELPLAERPAALGA